MRKKGLCIITAIIAMIALFGAFMAVASDDDSSKLTFAGVAMEARDDSVQGFLDFKIKNVESSGVSFVLEYNTEFVELSDAATNAAMSLDLPMYFNPAFAQINQQDFSADTFLVTAGKSGAAAGKYENVKLDVAVRPDAEGGNITTKNVGIGDGVYEDVKVVAAAGKELQLGRISFRIKDPAAFARLTDEELAGVFRVQTTAGGSNAFTISYVDLSSYPPVVFYDENSHLAYEFNVKNTIASIQLDSTAGETNAAAVYEQGSEADLLKYLNEHMQNVTVTYADGAQIADRIVWGGDDFTCDAEWNPKGGVYHVTQKYNDDYTLSAQLTVKPVTITGYTSDDDYITYPTAADVPADLSGLQLPTEAKPIFDTIVPGKTDFTVFVADSWTQTAPADKDFFQDKAEGEYTFSAQVIDSLPVWVTAGTADAVSVIRAIGTATAKPQATATVDDDGLLTITITRSEGSLPSDIHFVVRMPNGEVLDPDNFTGGGLFEVQLNQPQDGQAVIRLQAGDLTNGQQARLQQSVNLGNRLGSFEVAAQENGKPRSDWTQVAAEPRNNYYIDNTYTFDYSGAASQLFALNDSMTAPPLTITLPNNDRVATTYAGDTGREPGSLQTVTVDAWTKTAGEITAGGTVTFEGVLADTSYVNYGRVQNPDDAVKITLVLAVKAAPEDAEKLAPIEDVRFDKQQVGYVDLQTAGVSVQNIGTVDITGLTVTIDSDDFTIENDLPYLLTAGDFAGLQISTKLGLAVGKHTATVTIGSNTTASLASFQVIFEVTATPVYRLNLVVDNPNAGTAKALEGYTYAAGNEVTLIATPEEDCSFSGWQSLFGPTPAFTPDDTAQQVTFAMPDLDGLGYDYITVQAQFEESATARIRLLDLQLFNPDDTQNDLLNDTYAKVAFSPSVRDYLAVAAPGAEENRAVVKIDVSAEAPQMTVSATFTPDGGTAQTLTVSERTGEDGTYEIESFPLTVAPAKNLLTVTLTSADGTKDYTVCIYRKILPENMVQLGYGNSPYGLIMRDASATDKDAWKAEFDKGNCFTDGFTPAGGKTGLIYRPDAWGRDAQATNYDKDDAALFVYSGEAFTDPGFTGLTDSLGAAVEPSTVKRQLVVSQMTADAPKNLMDDFRTVSTKTVDLGSDAASNALVGLRVRPGVYAIRYTWRDFDGSTVSVQRPFIVLGARGDVNMDGSVTEEDAGLLMNRYNARLPYENLPGYESGGRLYQYRMCDVNTDRNVNAGDRNMILKQSNSMTQFYK